MPHVLSTGGWAAMKWSRLTNIPGDQWRVSIIDGSNMTKLEANQAVLRWITDAIDGRVPVFSRRGAPRPRSASHRTQDGTDEWRYLETVIGAGMSGCTDCRGAQPGGPKMKPSRSRQRCAARTSRAIATYSWVWSFQML